MSKETTDIKIEKLGMEAKPYDKVLAKVAELCPAAVQNGKVDFERLKAELADVVDENVRETYEFKWVGKMRLWWRLTNLFAKLCAPAKRKAKIGMQPKTFILRVITWKCSNFWKKDIWAKSK